MSRAVMCHSILFLLLAASDAQAQVASLGKGFLFDAGGSITSAPGEVISGANSIKGSSIDPNAGTGTYTHFLYTDPAYIHLTANQTYTVTLNYRVITTLSFDFELAFLSSLAYPNFLPGKSVAGAAGTSGTASLTVTLLNYPDYQLNVAINGVGSIAIDDIRVTDSHGQLVAVENAEGPALAPGPVNFQVTDAVTMLTDAGSTVRSAGTADLDGDGHPETVLTFTAPRPSTTPLQPILIESSGRMRLATSDFFPAGAPTTKHSPQTLFADLNNDGLTDMIFADAGFDSPPWQGSAIGVALNQGGGTFRNVQPLIPADQQTTRSYATAVGDVLSDGHVDILEPDENDGSNTALLRWNGTGFDEIRNWVPISLWRDYPSYLHAQSWMNLADIDQDGRQDLLVTGQDHNPNFQILFGAPGGFSAANLLVLPDGPFGHIAGGPLTDPVTHTTAEISPVLIADFNNDGRPDIFAIDREGYWYQPGVYTDTNDPAYADIHANGGFVPVNSTFQVRINIGSRQFVEVSSASTQLNLGRRQYNNAFAIDLNNDGFLDVVAIYQNDFYAGIRAYWGTTVFLNDGLGAFQVVDGVQLLPAVRTTADNGLRWNLGAFVPTVVNPQRTEGIIYEPVGGCGGAGLCAAPGVNLYKVVGGGIGTGPNFIDPATLGVPGFNEFFYLRKYPDAAAAVQAGTYTSGLAHYLAVGAGLGYLTHAAAGTSPIPTITSIRKRGARVHVPVAVQFSVGDSIGGPSALTIAAASSNSLVVPNGSLVLTGSGANRTVTITPSHVGTATITVFATARGMTVSTSFVLTASTAAGDFDGDGKTDVTVFRPSAGAWYALGSASNFTTYGAYSWGISTDVPVPGDYDGDGKSDVAVFRPSAGAWFILRSNTNFTAYSLIFWGAAADVPVPGDYDGDGITDVAVYRPSTGAWYVLTSTSNFTSSATYNWGASGDVAVPGDYDGDGKTDIAVYRPSTGVWFLLKSSTNFTAYSAIPWGVASDVLVPGNYDSDGITDIAVYRPSTGAWFVLKSSTNFTAYSTIFWGSASDVPVPADYDGDGIADVAVFRPLSGVWYVLKSTTNFSAYSAIGWGTATDVPVLRRP